MYYKTLTISHQIDDDLIIKESDTHVCYLELDVAMDSPRDAQENMGTFVTIERRTGNGESDRIRDTYTAWLDFPDEYPATLGDVMAAEHGVSRVLGGSYESRGGTWSWCDATDDDHEQAAHYDALLVDEPKGREMAGLDFEHDADNILCNLIAEGAEISAYYSGDVWGVVIAEHKDDYLGEDVHSVWGYYGRTVAEEAAVEEWDSFAP